MDKLKSAQEVIEKDLKFFKSICHPYNPEDEGKREKIEALTYALSILERLDEGKIAHTINLKVKELINKKRVFDLSAQTDLATVILTDILGE